MLIDPSKPRVFTGNLTQTAGEIYYAGDIHLVGGVSGKFNLIGDGDIVIDGDASETSIQASGNLVIRGLAASADGKMRLFAKGDMWLNSPISITAETCGDLIVHGDAKKTNLFANGQITMFDGAAMDSRLHGGGGLWISSAISSAPNATRLTAGILAADEDRYELLSEEIKKLTEQQRQMLNDLGETLYKSSAMSATSRKTPPKETKEKMTQLRTLTVNLDSMRTRQSEMDHAVSGKAVIACEKTLSVGVSVCLLRTRVVLDQPVAGPLSLFIENNNPGVIARQNTLLLARSEKEYTKEF